MQEEKELNENIQELNKLLNQRVSLVRNFLLGIITGIGSVIGAALIGSILLGLFAANLEEIPFLRDIIPQEAIQEYIDE